MSRRRPPLRKLPLLDRGGENDYRHSMGLPNKLTAVRLVLSPVIFLVFFIPLWTGKLSVASVPVLWVLFLTIETTDILDGHLARLWDQVSEIGKLLDPFADVISRLTYFLCFTGIGLMPIWILAVLVYREVAITFLRLVMSRRGIAMGASIWGKLKAVTYAVSGVVGFLVISLERLSLFPFFTKPGTDLAVGLFVLAAVTSVGSFVTYLRTVLQSEQQAR